MLFAELFLLGSLLCGFLGLLLWSSLDRDTLLDRLLFGWLSSHWTCLYHLFGSLAAEDSFPAIRIFLVGTNSRNCH